MDIVSNYLNWVEQAKTVTEASLIDFLESIGYKNIIWMVLSQKEVHLIDHSSNLSEEFISSFTDEENFAQIKEWVKSTVGRNLNHFGNDTEKLILYLKQDHYSNFNVVIAQFHNGEIKPSLGRSWTKLAMNHLNQLDKINTLENAIRLGYTGESKDIEAVSDITFNSLKPNFVDDVIPHIFYSIVHESFGPYIFNSIPTEMRDNHDNIIVAVKLFSSLDAEMVAEVGHVFTTDPVKNPVLGELFSIIFTLPNKNARGHYEIHSISLLIPNEFLNMSKSFIGEFKTKLFMAIEQIRYTHEENNWSIAVEPMNEHPKIANYLDKVLIELRQEIALSFALRLNPDDVLKW